MKYMQKSFTVPASSEKAPADCQHGWIAKGRCVLCGAVSRATNPAWDGDAPKPLSAVTIRAMKAACGRT